MQKKIATMFATMTAVAGAMWICPASGDNSWLKFSDPDGVFAVDLPNAPTVSHPQSKYPDGTPIPTTAYVIGGGGRSLGVEVGDFATAPDSAITDIVNGCVDGIKKRASEKFGEATATDSNYELDGHSGRAVHVTAPQGTQMDVRVFFVNHKLYSFLTMTTPAAIASASGDPQRFRDSVHFLVH